MKHFTNLKMTEVIRRPYQSPAYMARIEYYDGTAERVYYDIDVE